MKFKLHELKKKTNRVQVDLFHPDGSKKKLKNVRLRPGGHVDRGDAEARRDERVGAKPQQNGNDLFVIATGSQMQRRGSRKIPHGRLLTVSQKELGHRDVASPCRQVETRVAFRVRVAHD